jgi:hypothetical protein
VDLGHNLDGFKRENTHIALEGSTFPLEYNSTCKKFREFYSIIKQTIEDVL